MRALFLLLSILLLPGLAAAQDSWTDDYGRADVAQQVGSAMWNGGLATTALGTAVLFPKVFGVQSKTLDRVGGALFFTGIGVAVLAPPVMLGGALAEYGAMRKSDGWDLAGGSSELGTLRNGLLGVALYTTAVAMVPIAMLTQDRIVYYALIPVVLSALAAGAMINNNESAFGLLRGDSGASQRIFGFEIGF